MFLLICFHLIIVSFVFLGPDSLICIMYTIQLFPTSNEFCHLMISFAKSLDLILIQTVGHQQNLFERYPDQPGHAQLVFQKKLVSMDDGTNLVV